MGMFELANQLAILIAARVPNWTRQVAGGLAGLDFRIFVLPLTSSLAPRTAGDGVALFGAPVTHVLLAPREEAARRIARVRVTNVVSGFTYRIVINGVNCDYLATVTDDITDIANGLVASVIANAPAGVVDASAISTGLAGAGVIDAVLLRGTDANAEATFNGDWNLAHLGNVESAADLASFNSRIWALPDGIGGASDKPTQWVQLEGITANGREGRLVRLVTGGYSRLFIEIGSPAAPTSPGTDGGTVKYAAGIYIGPVVTEE